MEQFISILLGVLIAIAVFNIIKLKKSKNIDLRSWIFVILATLLIPFGIAWAIQSVHETEIQAAIMGIIVFCGLGAIFAILAWRGIFPKSDSGERETDSDTSRLGVKITVLILLIIAVLSLPITLIMQKTSAVLSNKEKIQGMFQNHLLSDKALPKVVKQILAYQTLYGEYPDKLEIRMIQSVISGVEDEEMIKLLNVLFPEKERLQLSNEAIDVMGQWLNSTAAYPEFEFETTPYVTRLKDNAEFVIRWIYRNFSLPPMTSEQVQKFSNGEFSNNFTDYIGTPPDSIKEQLIAPAAQALKSQIDSANIPDVINLSKNLSQTTPEADMLTRKNKIENIKNIFNVGWILPVLIMVAALVILYFSKLKLLSWLGVSVLLIGLFGLCMIFWLSSPVDITESLVVRLSESAPPPGLGVMYYSLPNLLRAVGQSLLPIMIILTFLGLILSAVAYFNNIKRLFVR